MLVLVASEVMQMIQVMDGEQSMSYQTSNNWNLLLRFSLQFPILCFYQEVLISCPMLLSRSAVSYFYQEEHLLSIEENIISIEQSHIILSNHV